MAQASVFARGTPRTKNETTPSAKAASGMTSPPTRSWIENPRSPVKVACWLSMRALSTTPPSMT